MPKAIFNIAYTLPNAPTYMTGNRRAEYQAQRSFYDMTASYNYFEYVLDGKKVERNKDAQAYYTRGGTNGGLFNLEGTLSEEQVDEMKSRLAKSKSIIWHGFISFDEETSKGFQTQESAVKFMKQTFGAFLERTHLNPKNIELYAALHTDKSHHHHIHFSFFEKEPKRRDKNGELGFTKRGKIDATAIDNYLVSANMHLSEHGEEYYSARDKAIDKLKAIRKEMSEKKAKSMLFAEIAALKKKLPEDGRLVAYKSEKLAPYREQIDKVVELVIASDAQLAADHKEMLQQLARVKTEVRTLVKDNKLVYVDDKRLTKDEIKAAMNGNLEGVELKNVNLKNIDYFERLQFDYKARVGNIILGMCKDLSFREYYDACRKNRNQRIKAKNKARRKESVLRGVVSLLSLVEKRQKANFIQTVEENERLQELERRNRA